MAAISKYQKCVMYLGRTVRIKAKDGNTYTGKILKVDGKKVYLKVRTIHGGKKAHTSFFPFILPLVLFDILSVFLFF
jgi:hypothetical protein